MFKWLFIAVIAGAGCSSKLETGYKPRKLGESEAVRRGYYAPAFTPEAQAASQDRDEEFQSPSPAGVLKAHLV